MKKLLLILFAVLFVTSLSIAQDLAELREKVQAMNDEYAQLMVTGDADKMFSYYAEDVISMPSYEPMVRGLDAMKKSYEQMSQSGMKISAFETKVTDLMKYGDLVVDIGTYEITMSIPGMDQPWTDNGKYMTLWEMQDDGSMKVKVETWNTDVNPWMEMEQMEEHEAQEEHMEMEEKK